MSTDYSSMSPSPNLPIEQAGAAPPTAKTAGEESHVGATPTPPVVAQGRTVNPLAEKTGAPPTNLQKMETTATNVHSTVSNRVSKLRQNFEAKAAANPQLRRSVKQTNTSRLSDSGQTITRHTNVSDRMAKEFGGVDTMKQLVLMMRAGRPLSQSADSPTTAMPPAKPPRPASQRPAGLAASANAALKASHSAPPAAASAPTERLVMSQKPETAPPAGPPSSAPSADEKYAAGKDKLVQLQDALGEAAKSKSLLTGHQSRRLSVTGSGIQAMKATAVSKADTLQNTMQILNDFQPRTAEDRKMKLDLMNSLLKNPSFGKELSRQKETMYQFLGMKHALQLYDTQLPEGKTPIRQLDRTMNKMAGGGNPAGPFAHLGTKMTFADDPPAIASTAELLVYVNTANAISDLVKADANGASFKENANNITENTVKIYQNQAGALKKTDPAKADSLANHSGVQTLLARDSYNSTDKILSITRQAATVLRDSTVKFQSALEGFVAKHSLQDIQLSGEHFGHSALGGVAAAKPQWKEYIAQAEQFMQANPENFDKLTDNIVGQLGAKLDGAIAEDRAEIAKAEAAIPQHAPSAMAGSVSTLMKMVEGADKDLRQAATAVLTLPLKLQAQEAGRSQNEAHIAKAEQDLKALVAQAKGTPDEASATSLVQLTRAMAGVMPSSDEYKKAAAERDKLMGSIPEDFKKQAETHLQTVADNALVLTDIDNTKRKLDDATAYCNGHLAAGDQKIDDQSFFKPFATMEGKAAKDLDNAFSNFTFFHGQLTNHSSAKESLSSLANATLENKLKKINSTLGGPSAQLYATTVETVYKHFMSQGVLPTPPKGFQAELTKEDLVAKGYTPQQADVHLQLLKFYSNREQGGDPVEFFKLIDQAIALKAG